MAYKRGKGLKFFPMETDFLQDRQLRRVLHACGPLGPLLYIYILCCIYSEGYFLRWDTELLEDAAIDLRCEPAELMRVLDCLIARELFDRRLFESRRLLSSRAVQQRYMDSCRAMHRKLCVQRGIWLLSEEESLSGQVSFCDSDENSVISDAYSGNCDEIPEFQPQKRREEKEKRGEERERETACEGAADPARPDSFDFVLAACGESLGRPAGRTAKELRRFVTEQGAELVLHALDRCAQQDKLIWSYFFAILRRYRAAGFTSLEQAITEEDGYLRASPGRGTVSRPACAPLSVDMGALEKSLGRV